MRVGVLKRRAGITDEIVRFKKERLDDAEQEYEDEHPTFTCFSKQLEEKWERSGSTRWFDLHLLLV